MKHLVMLLLLAACSPSGSAPSTPRSGNVGPTAFPPGLAVMPREDQDVVAESVMTMLEELYYDPKVVLDDAFSRSLFEEYLDSLDHGRVFLLASDVAEFDPWRTVLDDAFRMEDVSLVVPFVMFDRYRTRVIERCDELLARLDGPIDLTDDESWDGDVDGRPWPASEADAHELWRRRLEEELIRLRLQDMDDAAARAKIRDRYQRTRDDIASSDPGDVLEVYLHALAQTFDPHTSYFGPKSQEDFRIDLDRQVEGIGAELRVAGQYVEVVRIVTGGPAELAGELKAGDRIVAVAQDGGDTVDVVGMRLDRVVKMIRGSRGTAVVLTVIPAEQKPSVNRRIRIVRDKVDISSGDPVLEHETFSAQGHDLDVAVIRVPTFLRVVDPKTRRTLKSTTEQVRGLLNGLKADAVLLDLRGNTGGVLDEAVELAGLFIDAGPIVRTLERSGAEEVLDDPDPAMAWRGPLGVLTGPTTASASEIVAAAVQDYDRGVVIGTQTHGKGTVQRILSLAPLLSDLLGRRDVRELGGGLKLTIAKFYRISGGSTQRKGVLPDVTVPSPFEGMVKREDDLPRALPWDEIRPLSYFDYEAVDPVRSALVAASAARLAASPSFASLERAATRQHELDVEGPSSLVLTTRQAELKALDAERAELTLDGDPVLREGLAVMADLVDRRGPRPLDVARVAPRE